MNTSTTPPTVLAPRQFVLDNLIDGLARRLQRGDGVDLDQAIRDHPELAEDLRKLWPAMQVLAELSRSSTSRVHLPGEVDGELGVLGDFRLLRQVGRGGMGIVFEAEQMSLRRRVALKILPLASMLDGRHLQRFKNEAAAAASLHHTNIVPVFATGCERGVYYYAMQFIEGRTLAEVIQELRQAVGGEPQPKGLAGDQSTAPGREETPLECLWPNADSRAPQAEYFRSAARLGIQAAEALAHAHQLGIVHRDIKPANLMLETGPAALGKPLGHAAGLRLWVTDFGLAQMQGDEKLTRSGDVLGTLRYMSPEQALAKHEFVDHRTDIYALGATLYELLTLTPACPARDREALLLQIAYAEPLAPRRLQHGLPPELETIVLKALAKAPVERYSTAQELADDLERFLKYEPIRARRPTLWQRTQKWARRHRPLVTTTGVAAFALLALTAGLLAYNNFRLEDEQYKTHLALDREGTALLAETAERERAQDNLRQALDVLDKIYLRVIETQFPKDPQRRAEDEEFLRQALPFYEKFAAGNLGDRRLQRDLVRAYQRMGHMQQYLGQREPALHAYRRALELHALASGSASSAIEDRLLEGNTHLSLSLLFKETGRYPEAAAAAHAGFAVFERLVAELPSTAHRDGLQTALNARGTAQLAADRDVEADKSFRSQADLLRPLLAETPGNANWLSSLGGTLNNLALLSVKRGDLTAARLQIDEAIGHQQEAIRFSNRMPRPREFLCKHYSLLIRLHARQGEIDQAVGAARTRLEQAEALHKDYPAVPRYRHQLAISLMDLGMLVLNEPNQRNAPEAEELFQRALDHEAQVVLDATIEPDSEAVLGRLLSRRAFYHLARKELMPARRLLERALHHAEAALNAKPHEPEFRADLASHLGFLARAFSLQGLPKEALLAQLRHLDIVKQLAAEQPRDPQRHLDLGTCRYDLAMLYREQGQLKDARAELVQGIQEQRLAQTLAPDEKRQQLALRTQNMLLTEVALALEDHATAAQSAEDLLGVSPGNWQEPSRAARTLSHCAVLAEGDNAISPAERLEARDRYARRARALLAQAQELINREKPQYIQAQQLLFRACMNHGHTSVRLADFAAARGFFDQAAERALTLEQVHPREIGTKNFVCEALDCRSAVLLELGDHAAAAADLRLLLACADRMKAQHPGHAASYAFHSRCATSQWQLGHALWQAGAKAEARKQYETARDLFEANLDHALKQESETNRARAHLHLAWVLTTCPDEGLRQLERAAILARKATELAPNDPLTWHRLGAAHYRAGDCAAALPVLERAAAGLQKAPDRHHEFFWLVLVHAQLGNKAEARRWYDLAVMRFRKNRQASTLEEYRRFQDEAASKLGLKQDTPAEVPPEKK